MKRRKWKKWTKKRDNKKTNAYTHFGVRIWSHETTLLVSPKKRYLYIYIHSHFFVPLYIKENDRILCMGGLNILGDI